MNEHERTYIRSRQAQPCAARYPFQGRMMTVDEIADVTGFHPCTIRNRVRLGISLDAMVPQGRTPKLYEFRGRSLTVKAIAAELGTSIGTVYNRRSGNRVLDGAELVDPGAELPSWATPVTFKGKTNSIAGWARTIGISQFVLSERLRHGWPIQRALTEPVMRNDERKTRGRNAAMLRRIINRVRFHRLIAALQTGGQSQTFDLPEGTGVGRHETYFEGA